MQKSLDRKLQAIHDDPHLLTRITEPIEYLERAARAADRVNLERQHHQDLIRVVQRRDSY